ncbi:fimbria/pilus periplasmic chaperone [Escherichia coli]
MALLIFAVLSLLVAGELQAGVVVGGTRFIFPADKESIAILLTNTSRISWLINSKINRPTRWAGGEVSTVPAPITGRSTAYSPEARCYGHVALAETESDILPVDRETLFGLSVLACHPAKLKIRA